MEKKYEGQYLKLFEETIGKKVFEKVYIRNAVQVVPFVSDDEIILIKEERVAETPKIRVKMVTGFIEDNESPKDCAIKELQEEIGKKPGVIGEYMVRRITGSTNTDVYIFLAFDLVDSKLSCDDDENILEIMPTKIEKAYEMVMDGTIPFGTAANIIVKLHHEIKIKKINPRELIK